MENMLDVTRHLADETVFGEVLLANDTLKVTYLYFVVDRREGHLQVAAGRARTLLVNLLVVSLLIRGFVL